MTPVPTLIDTLISSTAALVGLALVFLLLVASVLGLESEQARELLRRQAWFRRFEVMGPAELRFRGMISLGSGVCCFAALLTLRLMPELGGWPALALATAAVIMITLGAALLERAAQLDGLR